MSGWTCNSLEEYVMVIWRKNLEHRSFKSSCLAARQQIFTSTTKVAPSGDRVSESSGNRQIHCFVPFANREAQLKCQRQSPGSFNKHGAEISAEPVLAYLPRLSAISGRPLSPLVYRFSLLNHTLSSHVDVAPPRRQFTPASTSAAHYLAGLHQTHWERRRTGRN